MPLVSLYNCWRRRDDCESLHSIEGTVEPLTDDDIDNPEFVPQSFVCCGLIKDDKRKLPQDCYRLCFVNKCGDEMTDNDEQDLTHLVAVISQTLAIMATRRVHGAMIEVPTVMGGAVEPESGDA